jgi:methyl-accepting chemotaxis protein
LIIKKGEKSAMTGSSAGHLRWTNEMLDELADSVSGLRGSVSEVRDSVEVLQLTAQALLQIATQQQRENEARRAEITEIRPRWQESD